MNDKAENSKENTFSLYLKQTAFDSLFKKGDVIFADQDCIDSINRNLSVGIFFPFYYGYAAYTTYQIHCIDYDVSKYYKRDNSYFRIDSVSKYKHIKFGDCTLLIGEFSTKLYSQLGDYEFKDSIVLNNGKFKILLTDNYWR